MRPPGADFSTIALGAAFPRGERTGMPLWSGKIPGTANRARDRSGTKNGPKTRAFLVLRIVLSGARKAFFVGADSPVGLSGERTRREL
jgi:hypothetical protein